MNFVIHSPFLYTRIGPCFRLHVYLAEDVAILTVSIFFYLSPQGTASFTFSLDVYTQSDFTGAVPNPVALDKTLYFKASVTTASKTPNLDLFPESCWASKSSSDKSKDGIVKLITSG